jgi:hypothetical protein
MPTGPRAHPPPGPPPLRCRRAPYVDTSIVTPQLLWTHMLDLRPIFYGPKIMHISMCMLCTPLCVARYTQCRDKHGDRSTLGSQHIYTIAIESVKCAAPGRLHSSDTENGMSCALVFSCNMHGNITMEHGQGRY